MQLGCSSKKPTTARKTAKHHTAATLSSRLSLNRSIFVSSWVSSKIRSVAVRVAVHELASASSGPLKVSSLRSSSSRSVVVVTYFLRMWRNNQGDLQLSHNYYVVFLSVSSVKTTITKIGFWLLMDDQAFSPPFNQANHGDLLHQLKQRAVERRSPNQVLDGFIFCRFGFALSEKKWEKPYFGAYERLHNKALFFGVRLRSDLRKCSLSHRTFVAPLERLKLEYIVRGEQRNLFELIKAIAVSQGLKGFWKGNFVNILRTAPFKSINFYAYDTYRNQLLKMSGNEETTNFERFVAGAAARITATVLCIPMDTVKTCYVPALSRHKELIAELRPIHTKLSCQKEIARRHPVFKCNEVQGYERC